MKLKIANKWIKALRSGDYKQTTKVLRDDKGCFCALGVLKDIRCKDTGVSFRKSIEGEVLNKADMKWSGISHDSGCAVLSTGEVAWITILNDEGKTFDEIADFIEENWKSL